jgi:excisionase family DNA binding protein
MPGAPLILDVPRTLSGHLSVALGNHLTWLRRNGYSVPDGLAELQTLFRCKASESQEKPNGAVALELVEPRLDPLVLTYEEVARMLCCSPRSVGRLVSSGALPTVKVGGLARVRVDDLNAYVIGLQVQAQQTEGETAA